MKSVRGLRYLSLLLLPTLLIGCGGNERPEGEMGDTDTLAAQENRYDTTAISRARMEKDAAFRADDSPIPAATRASFTGLSYYPPTSAFAVSTTLKRLPTPEPVSIVATKGDVRSMIRYGTMTFTIAGQQQTLTVYKYDSTSAHLFVPFKDATNGRTTYKGGRYIDLEETPGRETYLLDFNLAYNPYCAYNEEYTCPIVPGENKLTVAIEAGETWAADQGH